MRGSVRSSLLCPLLSLQEGDSEGMCQKQSLCLYSSLGSCVHTIYGKVTVNTLPTGLSSSVTFSGRWPWRPHPHLQQPFSVVPALFFPAAYFLLSAFRCQDRSNCAHGRVCLCSVHRWIPSTKDRAWHMVALYKRLLKWMNCKHKWTFSVVLPAEVSFPARVHFFPERFWINRLRGAQKC